MIKINLLPYRAERISQRKKAFYRFLVLSGLSGALCVLLVVAILTHQIAVQKERNDFIAAENARLDQKITEIATLQQEIAALKTHQQAVENLQEDRNQSVYVMDELLKQVPEGMYLHVFKQDGQRVTLQGYAQSNEKVSELLHNLSHNAVWLEHPDLVEIRTTNLGQGKDVKDARKVFDFTVSVGTKRVGSANK